MSAKRSSSPTLKSCLERQKMTEVGTAPGDAVLVRTGHVFALVNGHRHLLRRRCPGSASNARAGSPTRGLRRRGGQFRRRRRAARRPRMFHPCHQHLIMKHGIYLHEGMTLEGTDLPSAAPLLSPMCSRRCRSSGRPARQADQSQSCKVYRGLDSPATRSSRVNFWLLRFRATGVSPRARSGKAGSRRFQTAASRKIAATRRRRDEPVKCDSKHASLPGSRNGRPAPEAD